MTPQPLDPDCLFASLDRYGVDYVLIGGMAAVLHGSPTVTNDADIVPDAHPDNLSRLSAALIDLDARIRSADDPSGIQFDPHPALMASISMLNLTTRCGNLDLAFSPAGIDDYATLSARSVEFDLDGTSVRVASLDDVIRSKETADRPRDRAVLPVLYALREEIARRE